MMLTKIDFIKNLAVFSDFSWKNSLGNSENFEKLNIIYGRNYSGKTTLSRIIRAFEIGKLSDKYKNPEFQISTDESYKLTQNIISNKQNFRVFNSDFINENLSFIHDENGKIEPFAILGEDNQRISKEIEKIKNELGKNLDEKTGLYKALDNINKNYKEIQSKLELEQRELDDTLKQKAKNMKDSFRDFIPAEYNKASLKNDIEQIQKTSFQAKEYILKEEQKLIREEIKEKIQKLNIHFYMEELSRIVKGISEKQFETSLKIQELVKESLLNNWVERGLDLHKERKICAFCGNQITNERIYDLQKHFDKEHKDFIEEINEAVIKIQDEKNKISSFSKNLKETYFYIKFQEKAKNAISSIKDSIEAYNQELDGLLSQISKKRSDIFHFYEFINPKNMTEDINRFINNYNDLVDESNSFRENLEVEQNKLKLELRFNTVNKIINEIRYVNKIDKITEMQNIFRQRELELKQIKEIIKTKEIELEEQKAKLNDEQKGAEKVNIYLSNFFSHTTLKLSAVEVDSESKKFYFEIERNGKKAFNLSEGECRLISFAYFVAKLNDVDTKDTKPIIWIDDPICSLDSNHIFFIYSLIYDEIVMKDIFSQLFISTHNLEFFKYLKRLNTKEKNNKKYFLVENKNSISNILIMPKYIKEYATEFNYLFHEIYKCSKIESPTDENYPSIYNFANNARKFMEIYLFYKYPIVVNQKKDSDERFKTFFGNDNLAIKFFCERITNEYSHLEVGGIERGNLPVDVKEFKECAQKILDAIKKKDEEQYDCLLKSIGVKETKS